MNKMIITFCASAALAVGVGDSRAEVKTLYASGDITWHKEGGWYSKKGDASTAQNWEDGSIAYFAGNLTADGDTLVYGIRYASGNRVLSANKSSVTSLGAGGLAMEANGPLRLYANPGAKHTLKLTADQTWTCNGNSAVRTFWLDPSNARPTSFTCDENVTLTLSEHVYFNNDYARTDVGFPGYVVVRDFAKYRQAAGAPLNAKRLTLLGPDAQLVAEGGLGEVASEICMCDGASWSADGQTWPETVTLVAEGSRECRFSGMLRIPDGDAFNVRVEEGATLVYSAVARRASDGAFVTPTVSGRGTFVNKVRVVTDDPVTDSRLVANAGDVIIVAGDGLGAGTTVTLNGGEMRFAVTSTVSSPVEVVEASTISADAGGVANLEGALTVSTTNSLTLGGTGVKLFSGNGIFGAESKVSFDAGTLVLQNATWTFGNKSTFDVGSEDGPFAVSNATLDAWCESMKFSVGVSEQGAGAVLLGANSVLKLGHGSLVQLGFATSSLGVLRVDGGHYYDRYASSQLCMGYGNGATGRVEFVSGTFAPASSMRTNSGSGEFLWTGGKWLFDNVNCKSVVTKAQRAGTLASPISFEIDGPDCVMAFKTMTSSDQIDTIDASVSATLFDSSWYCTEAGRLTLTNEHATKTFTLNFRHAFTNINLRVCGDRLRLTKDADVNDVRLNEWILGPDAAEYETACEAGAFPYNDIRIISGGVFKLHDWRNSSIRNIYFEPASILALTSSDACGLTISGVLTLPTDAELAYLRTATVATGALVAAKCVNGNPAFVQTSRSRTCRFRLSPTSLDLLSTGLIVIFR